MRFVAAIVGGCALMSAAAEAVHAQELSFAGVELRTGKVIAEAECRTLPGAVWVVVEAQGECIRYYHAGAGKNDDPIVFLHDDVAATNARGDVRPRASYLAATPVAIQAASENW